MVQLAGWWSAGAGEGVTPQAAIDSRAHSGTTATVRDVGSLAHRTGEAGMVAEGSAGHPVSLSPTRHGASGRFPVSLIDSLQVLP